MAIEITARKRKPRRRAPAASPRPRARHRLWRRAGRDQHRARQGALSTTCATALPCLDPDARGGRREGAGAAARGEHASVQAAGPARDFQRVQKNKKLHMEVPLHFTNAEKSPGVKDQGGVVSHVLNEIDITCFPDDLPEFIEVDLGILGRQLDPRARPQAAEGRGARAEEGRKPGRCHRRGAAARHRGRGSRRCRSRGCAVGDSDHRAGRRAEGRRSCRRREGREARCRQRRRQGCRQRREKEKK